jgi:hypothetical protein
MVVLVATMFTTLLMFVGLAIDAGQLFVARRTMQEAADAAAYAGAVVIYQHQTQLDSFAWATAQAAAESAAENDLWLNFDPNSVENLVVTIASPPTTGPYVGEDEYIEVTISGQVRTMLVPAQSVLSTVSVRAVAGSEPLNNVYAIMALDRGDTQAALKIRPGGVMDLTGGGVLVNSTDAEAAIDLGGDINYTCTPACTTDVAGGETGDWPNPNTGHNQEPDPFAGFPTPAIPSCAEGAVTSCLFSSVGSGTTVTLEPGVYTTSISGPSGTTFVMKPGVYILKAGIGLGGNNDLLSASATTTPSCTSDCGVFIFNTLTNYPEPGGSCGSLDLFGNAEVDLDPMTSGTYENFLVYQDPDCAATMYVRGNGVFTGSGTIYVPGAAFEFDGQNATLTGSQLVANTVDIQTGNISITFDAASTAQPILPRLAE